ncbi:MAG: hypothetical protein VXW65_11035 [Pseudomonadota bacterium]|nr:hypothetical protein [Pseudomonadota bacterium]
MNSNAHPIRQLNPSTPPSMMRWVSSTGILVYALWLVSQHGFGFFSIVMLMLSIGLLSTTFAKQRCWRQRQFIEDYNLPQAILHTLRREHAVPSHQLPLVERGFKDFCQLQVSTPQTLHHLPSKAVDALWHAFILDTQRYADFCQQAFGRMLHHHPATEMQDLPSHRQTQALKATWRGACQLENIRPQSAHTLPFLFSLDQQLTWPNGLHYQLDQLNNLLRYNDGDSSDVGSGGTLDLSDCGDSSSSSDSGSDSSGCGGGCGGGD